MALSAAGACHSERVRRGAVGLAQADVTFVLGDGTERRAPLDPATADAPLETVQPVRSFPSFRGQRNFPGLWWSATSGRHVGYESWLERDHAMLLDFDPQVVGFASQPFRLSWWEGRHRSHVPDFFARLADGTGVVIDCRPAEHVPPADAEAFAFTEQACEEVGWRYRLVHAPDQVLVANVKWLAGFRHPRQHRPEVAARLTEVFAQPRALVAGAEAAGDTLAVLPVLFHLLWRSSLEIDLGAPLDERSLVSVPGA